MTKVKVAWIMPSTIHLCGGSSSGMAQLAWWLRPMIGIHGQSRHMINSEKPSGELTAKVVSTPSILAPRKESPSSQAREPVPTTGMMTTGLLTTGVMADGLMTVAMAARSPGDALTIHHGSSLCTFDHCGLWPDANRGLRPDAPTASGQMRPPA